MRLPPVVGRFAGRGLLVGGALAAAVPVTRTVASGAWLKDEPKAPPRAELVNVPRKGPLDATLSFDSLVGRSGRLRARLITQDDITRYPVLIDHFGPAVRQPSVNTVTMRNGVDQFAFITLRPWQDKAGGYVNRYHVGWWPGERQQMPSNYDNPIGFIEVTRENLNLRLSEHFEIADFITHDQGGTWPKYLVLREELIDKLELVLNTLEAQGIPTQHVVVLSGFRTPQYNARISFEGAAYASRHQFGDAADVIIDANRDGRMDDLNRDGVVDFADTDVINRAVEKVEHEHPELVGGLGLYHAMGPSGPFAHIDVRGTRARWSNQNAAARNRTRQVPATRTSAGAVGRCRAEGDMAALCARMR